MWHPLRNVRNLLDDIVERFGKIDILVNNAGINKDGPYTFHE